MKTLWQEYSGIACSYSSAPDYVDELVESGGGGLVDEIGSFCIYYCCLLLK